MPVLRGSLAFAFLLVVGCGGGDDDDDDVSDGAVVDSGGDVDAAGPVDAGPDGEIPIDAPAGPCNELANDAPAITAARSTADAPGAIGGGVQAGTYFLTEDIFWEAAANMTLGPEQGTMTISGTTMQVVTSINNGPDLVSTSTFETSGPNEITLTQTCPNELTQGWQFYSADGDALALHQINDQKPTFHRVQIWTRQ